MANDRCIECGESPERERKQGVCGRLHMLFEVDFRGIVTDGKAELTAAAVIVNGTTIPIDLAKMTDNDRAHLEYNVRAIASLHDKEEGRHG